jgi:hypothetical protein
MRTTINVDDDVLRAVREVARLEGRTLGEVLSALARRSLASPRDTGEVRNGISLLPDRPGVGLVTPDIVRRFHLER